MSQLRYDLLLDLYRGQATAVERIAPEDLDEIAIETPLTRFLLQADSTGLPRHVVLTGNAGDGKSFAAQTARVADLSVVLDASQLFEGSGDPLVRLASHLEGLLRNGRRLLLAINRGQIDRLLALAGTDEFPLTATLLTVARSQLTLAVDVVDVNPEVAAVDLGLFDTVADSVLNPLLEKVASATITELLDGPTRDAATAAQEALGDPEVCRRVKRVMRASRVSHGHATMRQLWSLAAYLITGGRRADDTTPLTLGDSLGARLFDEDNRATLLPRLRRHSDPSLTPQASLARRLLDGTWQEALADCPGLKPMLSLPPDKWAGLHYVRVAAVHGAPDYHEGSDRHDTYDDAVDWLLGQSTGWIRNSSLTNKLLRGIYGALNLWRSDSLFPVWTKLCFDATRIERAGAVAIDRVSEADLRIALPRPPEATIQAFGGSWWSPYVLLGSIDRKRSTLRLTPRVFRALYSEDARQSDLDPAELLNLSRWLANAPVRTSDDDAIRILGSSGTFSLRREPIGEKIHIENEANVNE